MKQKKNGANMQLHQMKSFCTKFRRYLAHPIVYR